MYLHKYIYILYRRYAALRLSASLFDISVQIVFKVEPSQSVDGDDYDVIVSFCIFYFVMGFVSLGWHNFYVRRRSNQEALV